MKKNILFIISMLVLTSCNIFSKSDNEGDFGDTNVTNPGNDINEWKDVVVSTNDNYVISDGVVKINLNNASSSVSNNNGCVALDKQIINISGAGTYYLSGTLGDGTIIVSATKYDNVYLILNGVDITSSTSAPINIVSSDRTFITLVDDSVNKLTDNLSTHVYYDTVEQEPNACLFSKDDLTIDGNGALYVNGNFNHGIISKDDLKIKDNPTICVKSLNNGIQGNDSLIINGGYFEVTSQGDALHTKTYLGYDSTTNNVQGLLNIKNGEFTLTSDGDAISSCCDLLIENGVFKITTFGGADNAPSHESDNPGQDNGGRPGGKGPRASSSTFVVSCKGIKACTYISSTEYYGSNLKIIGGSFTLDTYDDAIHSESNVDILGGEFLIKSGDDGVHSNIKTTLSNCNMTISKCYEGVEGVNVIFANGSNIRISSNNDAINSSRGNERDSEVSITFEEGCYTYVETNGDGIDSNGYVYQNGGTVIVVGPNSSGNGPLDSDLGYYVNGGLLLAFSISSAMTDANISSSSSQYTFMTKISSSSSGIYSICDSSGNELVGFNTNFNVGLLFFSCPSLQNNSTYYIYGGGTHDGELKDLLYTSGTHSSKSQIKSITITSKLTSQS